MTPGLKGWSIKDGIFDPEYDKSITLARYANLSEIEKPFSSGSLDIQPKIIKGKTSYDYEPYGGVLTEKAVAVDSFTFSGADGQRNIVFGNIPKSELENFPADMPEIIQSNPFSITGLSSATEDGRRIGMDYAYAHSLRNSEYSPSQIDAMLYAGVRGDDSSMKTFNELAVAGKKEVDQLREDLYPQDFIQRHLGPKENPGVDSSVHALNESSKAERLKELEEVGLHPGDTKNLAIVHERQSKYGGFHFDEEGNLLIYPTSAFRPEAQVAGERL